jgi:hypothetical protein
LAEDISAGRKMAAIIPMRTVAIPSRIKIHRQPARPATPSILMIAVASNPGNRANIFIKRRNQSSNVYIPPKAPESEAAKAHACDSDFEKK